MQLALDEEVDRTILKIQKEQGRDIQEEKQLVGRLEKVDQLVSDLKQQDAVLRQETEGMQKVEQQTALKVRKFQIQRTEQKQKLQREIEAKAAEIKTLRENIAASSSSIKTQVEGIKAARTQDAQSVSMSLPVFQSLETAEKQIYASQQETIALLSAQKQVVAEFYLKKKSYDSQVGALEAKLEAENGRRQRDQDEHLKNEQLAFEEVAKNLDLKRLQFQLTY